MRKYPLAAPLTATAIASVIAIAAAIFNPPDAFEVKLDAPASIKAGEIAVLDVSQTGASSYAWTVTPESPCRLFENGTKLAFSHAVTGNYLFIVAAAKEGVVSTKTHSVAVDGIDPGPGPGPAPPEAFAGRLKRIYAAMPGETKGDECKRLADAFTAMASVIAAGAVTEPGEIIKAMHKMGVDALGPSHDAWAAMREAVRVETNGRQAAGTLTTAPDYVATFKEIAGILRGLAPSA